MHVSEYFDRLYRDSDRYWWQGKERHATDPDLHPRSLLTQQTLRLLKNLPPGRALDLGAGEGPDAIRLAMLGYSVDAVEISSVAAEKITRFAEEENVSSLVRVTIADLESYTPAGEYDIIICNGVLHYIKNKTRVVTKMQSATRKGGLNVVSLWSTYTTVPEFHNSVPVYCDDEDGVVVKLYSEWEKELLYFERDKPESAHSDLPPHRHSHIKFIARRPAWP
jgi:2-polyprenyl-3-methyl-5-hydroxy-6-metoxy-1,4-benzoquinol methylase